MPRDTTIRLRYPARTVNCYGLEQQQELLELAVAIHKSGVIMLSEQKARFIEIVRALADIFHITINDVYVKKAKLLDRCTAVTPFLDKLKKAYEQVVEGHLR